MKRRRFLSLALALMLIISLCACKTKVVDDSTDATHGNAPVTGQKRDETTTAPQTTKATESTTLAQRKTEKGKLDPNTGTYTGLSPLPKIKLIATDPQNTRGLSTATVGYSYGVSKNGVPHQNSTNAQKYFDEKGFNAVSISPLTAAGRTDTQRPCSTFSSKKMCPPHFSARSRILRQNPDLSQE